MKTHVEVEQVLESLGHNWPAGDSLAEGVLKGIKDIPPRPATRTTRGSVTRRLFAVAASLAMIASLWWVFRGDTSLFGQVRDAVHRARTFQMIVTVPADGERPEQRAMAVWYERGVGFREEQASVVSIGNAKDSWRYLKDQKLAIRSKSNGLGDLVDRVLDAELGQVLKDAKYERYEAGDQTIDGKLCRAHLLSGVDSPIKPEVKAGKQRVVLLLDDLSRIARIITEVRSQDRWVPRVINDWKYDLAIDRSLFQAQFGNDIKIVDADDAFEQFVDLKKAVHREERSGLWYAIHHVERLENGGLFLVSSVRGTEATLKKYPLTQRRLQPGMIYVDGPATNFRGSQGGSIPGFTVELASVNHQGIEVMWWVLLPLREVKGTPFDVRGDTVKVPLGISPQGEYARANHVDDKGVTYPLQWEIELDALRPKTLPTLDGITRRVYADVATLEAVPFKFLNLGNRGMLVPYWIDLKKITPAQFSEAVAGDVQWWMDGCPLDDRRWLELRKSPSP